MAVGAERRKENTPHEELMAGNLGKVVPVRIADYDTAAKSGGGRLGTTFVTDYDQNAPQREEAPPQEETPETPREEGSVLRGRLGTTFVTDYDQNAPTEEGEAPPVERLPEDIDGGRSPRRPAEGAGTKAAPQGKPASPDWDVLEGEVQRRERPRTRGRGKEFNPTED